MRLYHILVVMSSLILLALVYLLTPKQKCSCKPSNEQQEKPATRMEEMFVRPSVWSEYDPPVIRKIYNYNDLNQMNVSL